ncbi:response regulator [Saccharibacillus alkalitolerans]|uniref:Response regulator n=1 Tax=Saccharibacillus alkalitolerans TaxID=2705290 RepID=A0ABX0F5D0_9BACL|nr:response regulator [Saccharibacillus alkalitolerans]NGZ75184.1 response regulator [Saccharibacillus alkalitolerans]
MQNAKNRILYIEDDVSNMLVMRHVFKQKLSQLTLLESLTVEEGLEQARAASPCLILMDLKFPGMDGYQGLTELRRRPETLLIPVWAVSACVLDEEIEQGMRAGFDVYWTKPLEMKSFVQAVRTFWSSCS